MKNAAAADVDAIYMGFESGKNKCTILKVLQFFFAYYFFRTKFVFPSGLLCPNLKRDLCLNTNIFTFSPQLGETDSMYTACDY